MQRNALGTMGGARLLILLLVVMLVLDGLGGGVAQIGRWRRGRRL